VDINLEKLPDDKVELQNIIGFLATQNKALLEESSKLSNTFKVIKNENETLLLRILELENQLKEAL